MTPASVARPAHRPRRFAGLGVSALPKNLAVRLEREQQAQSVGGDEQHRQTHAQLLGERRRRRRVGFETAEGTSSAIVARKSRPACRRALTRLYSCTWCLSPPSRNDAPSMNNVLVTIAPAMDAFTSMYCPARNARQRDDQFGQVSQRGVEQAADRIARLGRHGFGGMTQEGSQRDDGQDREQEEQRVRCGRGFSVTNTTGTNASNRAAGC